MAIVTNPFLGDLRALAVTADPTNLEWPHAALNEVLLLSGPAWAITEHRSLLQLWTPQAIRGSNTQISGGGDFIANVSRVTEGSLSLGMTVVGECDHTGAAHTDTWAGLYSNLNYLETHLVRPGFPRTCRYYMPGYPAANRLVEFVVQFDTLITGESVEGHDEVNGTPGGAMCLAILQCRIPTPIVWP